jgi:hypothetical protein
LYKYSELNKVIRRPDLVPSHLAVLIIAIKKWPAQKNFLCNTPKEPHFSRNPLTSARLLDV